MFKEPTIMYSLAENFEQEYQRSAEYQAKRGPTFHLSGFMTTEVISQRMTKVAVDYSTRKVRGTVEVIRRTYDFETQELRATNQIKQVVHVPMDCQRRLPGESMEVVE